MTAPPAFGPTCAPHNHRMRRALSVTNLYLASITAAGFAVFGSSLFHFRSHYPVEFACYLTIAVLSSALKVSLPGVTGTMSTNFVFILLAIIELGQAEMLVLSCVSLLMQLFWRPKKPPGLIKVLFNLSSVTLAASAAYQTFYALASGPSSTIGIAIRVVIAATVYFLVNTLSIACVVALTEGKSLDRIWRDCYLWYFPYYLAGACVAGLLKAVNQAAGWQAALLCLPVLYMIYRSFRLYVDRLEHERKHAEHQKKHVEEMAGLHLRTIEALALAIEAKDDCTHQHLERVQVYALAVGRALGIGESELEALRAAAILHDIGKLAVPDHIISKPGKLTPEEFEKMKIHPVVGAKIVERVEFPYPVAPIVRSHHERWDGTGYPDGLAGEAIPIGARILSAVDCLDALASDRQYRRALPLDEAMETVAGLAGKSYDPRVVEVLKANYKQFEEKARAAAHAAAPRASAGVKVERGDAPAAGFESSDGTASSRPEFLESIAAAREEVQMLYELSQELGSSLSLHETLSVLDMRLRRLIPYSSIAVYVCRNGVLAPEYVQGEDFRLFSSLEIPIGEGLSGWVAANAKPIVNGNPSVEPGYLGDPSKFSTLGSALSAPLESVNGCVGVLTLYHRDEKAFTKDHLRILLAITSKATLALENALKYRQAELSATTDGLTGLPNARSLFLHLDAELSRARRTETQLAVLVCDLDGFKHVNDRFGHLQGNKVLKRVARELRENCREYDYVARMGGDEFVLVLPGAGPETVAQKLAVLAAIAVRAGLKVCGQEILSISVGEAYYPEQGTDAEQLLAEADRKMYQTKQQHKLLLPPPSPPKDEQTTDLQGLDLQLLSMRVR